MSTWLYQLSQDESQWPPNRYRIEVWEGERWVWPIRSSSRGDEEIEVGDIVVFFYAPSHGNDPGFYGWAIVLECFEQRDIYFRPSPPSDYLKMNPWWDDEARRVADAIRGPMRQRTLWLIRPEQVIELRKGIATWVTNGAYRA